MGQTLRPTQFVHTGRRRAHCPFAGDHPHAQSFDSFSHRQTDTAQPNDPRGLPVQFGEGGIAVEHLSARPFPFQLKPVGLVQLSRQDDHHPQHMLGNGDGVQSPRVGDDDLTINKLREKHMRRPG